MDAIESLGKVRDHYNAPNLTERLKNALTALGPEDQSLTLQQLGPLDHFHTRGMAATAELAKLAGIAAGMSVLDVGCGIGGPARFLAANHGCQIEGVDLSESFIDAARYLTGRTGQSGQVLFQTASALDLPFGDGCFDVVLLQHVAMNIADRAGLYREIRRVLKQGGRFATYDVVTSGGEPYFPVPWARTPSASFLLSADATREAVEQAGFRVLTWQDDTQTAKDWLAQLRASAPQPSPNLGVVVGPDFPQLLAGMGRSLTEGRLGVLTAIFEAIAS
jgi:sarcosine/dimethylglycine N-methyltransferase